MTGIKYFALDENEEVPYEFVVTRNVNGEPEFCASFVNTNTLAYGNGVLLKLHQRNDELRAENAKLEKRLAQYGLFREVVGDPAVEFANLRRELHRVERENENLRKLLSCALISAGYDGRRFFDTYLQEEEGTTLLQELRSLGIEVGV